jgi:hypothetical protein
MTEGAFSAAAIFNELEPEPGAMTVEEPQKKKPRTVGLESREAEIAQLGLPDSQSECFGCVYIGERDSTAVQFQDIATLIDMIRTSFPRTDPITMCRHVARRYALLRDQLNLSRAPHEYPLPEWSAASILQHITEHNTDPEMQACLRLREFQELIRVALHCSVEEDPDTGERRTNEKQCKLYMELVKAWELVAKSDPTKKMFYSGGAILDTKAASQPIIATTGKSVVDYWTQ